jgi:hypothetical protein
MVLQNNFIRRGRPTKKVGVLTACELCKEMTKQSVNVVKAEKGKSVWQMSKAEKNAIRLRIKKIRESNRRKRSE